MYNQADVFLFHDFSEKERRSNDFCCVALPANNLYQRAWARRQIDVAESRLHPAIYLEPGIPENSSESCKSFPDLKLGYCPQRSLLPSQLNASPARTFLCRSSPLVPFVIHNESAVGRKTAARLLVRPRAPVSLIRACPWACEVNSNRLLERPSRPLAQGQDRLGQLASYKQELSITWKRGSRLNQYFSFARLAYGISRAVYSVTTTLCVWRMTDARGSGNVLTRITPNPTAVVRLLAVGDGPMEAGGKSAT